MHASHYFHFPHLQCKRIAETHPTIQSSFLTHIANMSKAAMDAGIEVKVEPYDGTYECLFCGDSVRGWAALACSQCNSNPFHRPGSGCDPDPKYAEVCPTCGRKTVEV